MFRSPFFPRRRTKISGPGRTRGRLELEKLSGDQRGDSLSDSLGPPGKGAKSAFLLAMRATLLHPHALGPFDGGEEPVRVDGGRVPGARAERRSGRGLA